MAPSILRDFPESDPCVSEGRSPFCHGLYASLIQLRLNEAVQSFNTPASLLAYTLCVSGQRRTGLETTALDYASFVADLNANK